MDKILPVKKALEVQDRKPRTALARKNLETFKGPERELVQKLGHIDTYA